MSHLKGNITKAGEIWFQDEKFSIRAQHMIKFVLNSSSPNGRASYEQHIAVLQDKMSCGLEDK